VRSAILLAGILAATLAACNGQRPDDNAAMNQPVAVDEANLTSGPTANASGENVAASEPAPVAKPPKSCEAEIGKDAAAELAKRCRFVSPATRPPCHPANPCEMIQDEIDRSCDMFGKDKPAECAG
jgi:hypothetical protein